MRILRLILSAVCSFAPALARGQESRASAPDQILVGAKIFTANPTELWAEAVAIRGDRIVAVGTTAKIRALASAATRVIDLGGRTVIPGINDAHDHIGDTGPVSVTFRTTAIRSSRKCSIRCVHSTRASRPAHGSWRPSGQPSCMTRQQTE